MDRYNEIHLKKSVQTPLYDNYEHLLTKIKEKKKDSIQLDTQNKIKYFYNNADAFLRDLSHWIDEEAINDVNILKENISINHEKSTYTTRYYEGVRALVPAFHLLMEDLEKPFKLFVMGQGNYGKSSVINSLIGTEKKYAKEDFKPATWKIDIFQTHQVNDKARLIYKDGTTIETTHDKANSLIETEETALRDSEIYLRKRRQEYQKQFKLSAKEVKEYAEKISREEGYRSDLIEVHWGIPNSRVLEKFSIVDTPGLNQENYLGNVVNSAKEYYHKADGVLWLLNAENISAQKPSEMLDELESELAEMGGQKAADSMIAVLNKIDRVSQTPGDSEKVIYEAKKIYGNRFRKILPYSAKNALEAVREKNQHLLQESGYNDLINEINTTFFRDAKAIQCQRKSEACGEYNRRLLQSSRDYLQQMDKDRMKLIKVLNGIKDEMNQFKLDEMAAFKIITDSYLNDMNYNLAGKISELSNIEKDEGKSRYIKINIFNEEEIGLKFKVFLEEAYRQIIESCQDIVRENRFSQYENLSKRIIIEIELPEISEFNINTELESWMPSLGKTTAYSAGIGLIFGPIGGLIGAGIGAYMSSKVRDSTIRGFQVQGMEIVNNLMDQFESFLDELTERANYQLGKYLRDNFKTLYNLDCKNEEPEDVSNKIINLTKKFIKSIDVGEEKFKASILELVIR